MKVGDRVNYTEFNIIKTGIIKEIGEFKGVALGYVITIAKHGRLLEEGLPILMSGWKNVEYDSTSHPSNSSL